MTEEQEREAARQAALDRVLGMGEFGVPQAPMNDAQIVALTRVLGQDQTDYPQQARDNRQTVGQGMQDLASSAYNGFTFGFGDNIVGTVGGVDNMLRGGDFSDGYGYARDVNRVALSDARERMPAASTAAEMVGGAIPAAAALPSMVGAGFASTIPRMLGLGAAEGAMFGAGNADSADDIATQTGLGALIGAGAGAVAPVAVAGARAVARPVAGLFNGALGRPSQAAAGGMLSRTLARTGDDISTLERRIAEAAEQSQEMFVTADAMGYPGQALLSGVARQPGEGAANIRDFLASRQMDQAPRVSGFLEDALGAPQTATQTREALETTRGALANEQFGAARQNARPVDVRGALGFIDEQVQPMQGMPGGAIDSALSRYRDRLSMPASALPDGVDAMDLSEFDRVYRVRQDLADDIGAAYRAGNNNQVRMLTDLRNRLDDALEASSDEYAGAMASFRDQSRVIDAIETGQRAGTRGRSDDILDVFRGMADQTPTPGTNVGPLRDGSGLPMAPQGMPSNQQDGFRAGLADTLMGRVENARPGANVVPPLQSMRNTEILNEVVGAPSPLPQQLQREATMAETNRIAVGGSPTADRLADQADMGDIGTLMSTGSPTATLMQMMARGAGSAITNRNEATRTLLAQALMSGNPREALEPLMRNAMMQARGDRTGEALLRQLAYGQLGVTGPP